jgi:hypothetical protein
VNKEPPKIFTATAINSSIQVQIFGQGVPGSEKMVRQQAADVTGAPQRGATGGQSERKTCDEKRQCAMTKRRDSRKGKRTAKERKGKVDAHERQ